MTRMLPLIGLALLLVMAAYTGFTFKPTATTSPDFTLYAAGEARKNAFFDYLLPKVEAENEAILSNREVLLRVIDAGMPGWSERLWLERLARTYELKDFDPTASSDLNELLWRVDVVPASMALAQAANESSWGTSRFAREGNNFFGQWCYQKGCGLVPNARSEGASHEVAAFHSPRESVRRYMNNINTHPAYQTLRRMRAGMRNEGQEITGMALISSLLRYSERGQAYVDELRSMIRVNNLHTLDG